jgi:hypothetical protein
MAMPTPRRPLPRALFDVTGKRPSETFVIESLREPVHCRFQTSSALVCRVGGPVCTGLAASARPHVGPSKRNDPLKTASGVLGR